MRTSPVTGRAADARHGLHAELLGRFQPRWPATILFVDEQGVREAEGPHQCDDLFDLGRTVGPLVACVAAECGDGYVLQCLVRSQVNVWRYTPPGLANVAGFAPPPGGTRALCEFRSYRGPLEGIRRPWRRRLHPAMPKCMQDQVFQCGGKEWGQAFAAPDPGISRHQSRTHRI